DRVPRAGVAADASLLGSARRAAAERHDSFHEEHGARRRGAHDDDDRGTVAGEHRWCPRHGRRDVRAPRRSRPARPAGLASRLSPHATTVVAAEAAGALRAASQPGLEKKTGWKPRGGAAGANPRT